MKRKNPILFSAAIFAAMLGTASLGIEDQAPKEQITKFKSAKIPVSELKVYMLKSHGEAIAKIEVPVGSTIEVGSADPAGHVSYDQSSRSMINRKGIVVKILSGTNSVTILADEIEERKVARGLSPAGEPGLKAVPTRPLMQPRQ
jgi:hypothetical protein